MMCILIGVVLLCANAISRYDRQNYYVFLSIAMPLIGGFGVFISIKNKKEHMKGIVLFALFICLCIVMLIIVKP
jgi:hypothetical protein